MLKEKNRVSRPDLVQSYQRVPSSLGAQFFSRDSHLFSSKSLLDLWAEEEF